MKFKPHKWTHHHVHRIYHLSMFAVFGFAILWVTYGIFVVIMQAQAGTIIENRSVQITAMVPVIKTIVSTSFSAGEPNPYYLMPAQPVLHVYLKNTAPPQKQSNTPVANIFLTQFPELFGDTNIPGAFIFISLKGPSNFNSSVVTDSKGNWSWQAGEPLAPGNYDLTVIAQNPNYQNTSAKFNAKIIIQASPNLAYQLPNSPNSLAQNGNGLGTDLYNIVISLPNGAKQIFAGDEITANIEIINLNPKATAQTLAIEYVTQDSTGSILSDDFEKLNVKNILKIQKSFYTPPDLPSGTYKLTARIEFNKILTTSSIYFVVKQRQPNQSPTQNNVKYLEGLIAILFFFSLIVYFEYNKVALLTKHINKVDEKDLKKED